MEKIICQKCSYYFVTWEPSRPYGCKAYNFKSKILPSIIVKQNSGFPCGFYNPKQRK